MSTVITAQNLWKNYHLWGRRSQFATLKSALLKRDVKFEAETSVPALRNVSFVIEKGEAFGVIGRNGSGKSTLLKIMSGILKPTSGRIVVQGRVAALIELAGLYGTRVIGLPVTAPMEQVGGTLAIGVRVLVEEVLLEHTREDLEEGRGEPGDPLRGERQAVARGVPDGEEPPVGRKRHSIDKAGMAFQLGDQIRDPRLNHRINLFNFRIGVRVRGEPKQTAPREILTGHRGAIDFQRVRAVRGAEARHIVSLHHAREALALGDGGHVDADDAVEQLERQRTGNDAGETRTHAEEHGEDLNLYITGEEEIEPPEPSVVSFARRIALRSSKPASRQIPAKAKTGPEPAGVVVPVKPPQASRAA